MARLSMTQDELMTRLSYDPDTGVFIWLPRTSGKRFESWNALYAGKPAGHVSKDKKRYVRIGLHSHLYAAHRLAWLYVHGRMPDDQIDHIDGDHANNRISNLREARCFENAQNFRPPRPLSLLGIRKANSRWASSISVKGKSVHIGTFDTKEQAHAAYLAAKRRYHTFQPVPREGGQS